MTLVRRTTQTSETGFIPLPSDMGRRFLLTTIEVCGAPLTVINVHLESPDLIFWRNRRLRHEQIEILKTVVEDHGSALVAGDFNVVFDDTSEDLIPPTWTDIWRTLHPEDPGLSWDPDRNDRAWQEGGFILPGFRLDRVFLISDAIRADSARLVGRDEIQALSDHYGLSVHLSCKEK